MVYLECRFKFNGMQSVDTVMRLTKLIGKRPVSTWTCSCRQQGVIWLLPSRDLADEMHDRLFDISFRDVSITETWPIGHK